jgi:hypothetical protein
MVQPNPPARIMLTKVHVAGNWCSRAISLRSDMAISLFVRGVCRSSHRVACAPEHVASRSLALHRTVGLSPLYIVSGLTGAAADKCSGTAGRNGFALRRAGSPPGTVAASRAAPRVRCSARERDFGRAREPSGISLSSQKAGFGDRRQQPGPGLGPHGPALQSFSAWTDDRALAAAGAGADQGRSSLFGSGWF